MLVLISALSLSLLSTAYLFRGYSSGLLIGEIFDTRLMIVLHEHWFRFLTGKTSFLDAEFFYPYPRSFALSDTFLLTGLTHSIFRMLGFEMIDSWIMSQFLWVFIGLLGWFFLARKIISNAFLQLIAIPLIATSFPFVVHLNERPNVIPYLLTSWIFFFIFNFYISEIKNRYTLNLGLALVSIPLLVLTSWYAGFFLLVFIIALLVNAVIFRLTYLKIFINKIYNLNLKIMYPFIFMSLTLSIVWGWIYLPELQNSASVARPKSEVIEKSPGISEIFNNSALGGSSWFTFLNTSYQASQESLIGISLLLFVLVVLFSMLILKKSNFSIDSYHVITSFLLTGLLIELIIIKFFKDSSVFIFLFDNITFFKSIRAPVRWHIYLSFLLIIIMLVLLNNLSKKFNKIKMLLVLIPFVVLLEQQKEPPGSWGKSDFISVELLAYQNEIKFCDSFLLDRPDTGYWFDMIEAVALTTYLDKPSVNGYSGSIPPGYPSVDWYSDGDLASLANWLEENNALANTCMLDGLNFKHFSKFNTNTIDFLPGRGFTGLEKSKSSSWAWSVWETSVFYLQSFKNLDKAGNLLFTLEIPDCLAGANFTITSSKFERTITLENTNSVDISIPIRIEKWERIPVTINKDPGFCTVNQDPRDLHFSLKDVRIEKKA